MNRPTITAADTLVGSLCREIWDLRSRARQVQASLQRCQHPGLGQRLHQELHNLAHRRLELQRLAAQCGGSHNQSGEPSLAVALLLELCRRPLVVA